MAGRPLRRNRRTQQNRARRNATPGRVVAIKGPVFSGTLKQYTVPEMVEVMVRNARAEGYGPDRWSEDKLRENAEKYKDTWFLVEASMYPGDSAKFPVDPNLPDAEVRSYNIGISHNKPVFAGGTEQVLGKPLGYMERPNIAYDERKRAWTGSIELTGYDTPFDEFADFYGRKLPPDWREAVPTGTLVLGEVGGVTPRNKNEKHQEINAAVRAAMSDLPSLLSWANKTAEAQKAAISEVFAFTTSQAEAARTGAPEPSRYTVVLTYKGHVLELAPVDTEGEAIQAMQQMQGDVRIKVVEGSTSKGAKANRSRRNRRRL